MPIHPLTISTTAAMIRNVPHISSHTSKISLQSCLTFNSVFQQPNEHIGSSNIATPTFSSSATTKTTTSSSLPSVAPSLVTNPSKPSFSSNSNTPRRKSNGGSARSNNHNNNNNNNHRNNNNTGSNHQQKRNFHTSQNRYSNSNTTSSAKTSNTSAASAASSALPDFQKLTKNVPKHNLPYFKQLMAFDECLAHNSFFDPKTGDVPGGTAQFWDSVEKIMPLYDDLLITGELNQRRIDELISLLRNGLRMHRFELSKLKKNIDRDLNSPLQQIQAYLKNSIIKISNDIVNDESSSSSSSNYISNAVSSATNPLFSLNKTFTTNNITNANINNIKISSRGLTNLFKAFTDMGLIDEAAIIWNKGKKDPKLYDLFTSESVLGSILTLLVENKEFNFQEIWSIYETIKKSKNENDIIHSELQVAMIRACLLKNKTEKALEIFKEITSDVLKFYSDKNSSPPVAVKNYMTMAHLSFIGYCQDFETANIFFNDSFENQMPYLTPIQINYVKKFMSNTWKNTKDFNKVSQIWVSTWKYFENNKKSTTAISSSLNDAYLDIFFEKFDNFNNEAAIELKKLLKNYSEIKSMDEPFFNCLITKSKKWENVNVFQSIVKVADLYNFPKTNVYHRCVLKASGSVELPIDEIFILFKRLINSNIQLGSNHLTNADWFAFRDATIHSKFLDGEKIDLYFKLFKVCCKHFLNLQNFKLYMNLDIGLDQRYRKVFDEFQRVNIDDVNLKELQWFNKCNAIVKYWNNRGVDI